MTDYPSPLLTTDPLTTREGWMRWINSDFSLADPPSNLQELTASERESYDDVRLTYHSNPIVVHTPTIQRIINTVRRLLILNRRQVSARRGLIINGAPGTGKSTAITQLGRAHDLHVRYRQAGSSVVSHIPVVYVTVPPAATPRMLSVEFARFLGLPIGNSARANVTDVTNAVCEVLCAVNCQLVLVDELQNIQLKTRAGSEVSDQLKYFSERIPATFVYAGFDLESNGMFNGSRGRQIATRFTTVDTTPFYFYGTDEQRHDWSRLVAAFEQAVRLHRHRPGSLRKYDEYLYHRTGGMIGSLSLLIRGAAIDAILDGGEEITKVLLDGVPLDRAAEEYAAGSGTNTGGAA